MFKRILIAGHGELAFRVGQTCERIGVETVAPDPADPTILQDADRLVALAKAEGAEAIHPGHTTPGTRAALARAANEAGLMLVGPPVETLATMADKALCREAAMKADVRVVPFESASSLEEAKAAADRLGLPVVIKPLVGADALGVTLVREVEDFDAAYRASETVARTHFHDARVAVERYIDMPRQLEITVVVDAEGKPIALTERECSLQRNFIPEIAESPSPLLTQMADGEALRGALLDACFRMSEVLELRGVASFEFLLDPENRFFFVEANSDLHGAMLASEMLTGVDPVELQLRLAAGEDLNLDNELRSNGHAFEVCVVSEAAPDGPAGGRVSAMRFPPAPHGKVRIEPYVDLEDQVAEEGRPILARIATYAPIRHHALLALDRTLAETQIKPMGTNTSFLRRVLNHDSFRAGQYDTEFAHRLVHGYGRLQA